MKTYTSLYLLFVLVATAACKEQNSNYCANVPTTHNCKDQDAANSCGSDGDCSGATPVCDVSGSKTCVQCIAPNDTAACTGATPACGSDDMCRKCEAHSECASHACLADGTCAGESMVAYVDPAGTDNTTCTKAMPCTSITKALATSRPYVKLTGTTDAQVSINNQNVTLLADPGAKLTSTSNGIVLEVRGSSQVSIFDLLIQGASGASGYGVSMPTGNTANLTLTRVGISGCQAGGVSMSGGALTITSATISGNMGGGVSVTSGAVTISRSMFAGNTGGGLSVSGGTFAVVGNAFFNNGTQTGTVGGVSISTSQSAANRLEFNSFNKNQTQNGLGSAIQCVAGTFSARNNIMSENGTLSNMEQVGGTCTHAYSIVRPGTLPPGTGNAAGDPLFVNTTTGDLHIMTGSPARHAADPNADLSGIASTDIDGDARMSPADIGADQVH